MKNLCFIFVVLSDFFCLQAQLLSYVRSNAVDNFIRRAGNILRSPESLSDAYYATRILESLNNSEHQCDCKTIAELAASSIDSYDAFHAGRIRSKCGC